MLLDSIVVNGRAATAEKGEEGFQREDNGEIRERNGERKALDFSQFLVCLLLFIRYIWMDVDVSTLSLPRP